MCAIVLSNEPLPLYMLVKYCFLNFWTNKRNVQIEEQRPCPWKPDTAFNVNTDDTDL